MPNESNSRPTTTPISGAIEIPWMPRWSVQIGGRAFMEGERVPWWFGYAWYLPYSDRAVFIPMPMNWIAALCRELWLRARKSEIRDQLAGLYRYGYSRGFKAGLDHGYENGLRHAAIALEMNVTPVAVASPKPTD